MITPFGIATRKLRLDMGYVFSTWPRSSTSLVVHLRRRDRQEADPGGLCGFRRRSDEPDAGRSPRASARGRPQQDRRRHRRLAGQPAGTGGGIRAQAARPAAGISRRDQEAGVQIDRRRHSLQAPAQRPACRARLDPGAMGFAEKVRSVFVSEDEVCSPSWTC